MGTPEFAVPSLEALAARCEVVAVVTRPDRGRGRGRALGESEVARSAASLGLEVSKPADPNDSDTRDALAARTPDLFAVVAFGAILSPALLAVPRLGAINLHGSLLPEYRGATPVQRALWDGRASTGVTTLWMDHGIDTGDLILQRWEPILPEDDGGALALRLAALGGPLLAESVALAAAGRAPRQAQDRSSGSYAGKLTKADGVIAWDHDAEVVWNRQRAVTPWPGATTWHRDKPLLVTRARPLHRLGSEAAPGTLLEIDPHGVQVACRPGVLRIERVKPEARSEMPAADWARGARLAPGERLASVTAGAQS